MSAIADILKFDSKPLPDWLQAESVFFNRCDIFGSRTVYYPRFGFDGRSVKLCALSHIRLIPFVGSEIDVVVLAKPKSSIPVNQFTIFRLG